MLGRVDLAVSADDLLLQFVHVPALLLEFVEMVELLSLFLRQLVELRRHRTRETCAAQPLIQLGLPDNLLQHSVAFLLRDQVLLMAHHVATLAEPHHRLRHRLLVSVAHPSVEDEASTDCGGETVYEYEIEGGGRVRGDESGGNLHTEQIQHDVGPVAVFSFEFEVFFTTQA